MDETTTAEKQWPVLLTEEEREFLLETMTALERKLDVPLDIVGIPVALGPQREIVKEIKKKLQ